MVLVWRIAGDSPNSPNFLPTKLSRYTVCLYLYLICNTDVPNAIMNVRIDNITDESFAVLWDEVMDIFTITYTVTWYEESGIVGVDTVNSPPYTVTRIIGNTSYNVTVVAVNNCCGHGPVSEVVVAMRGEPMTPGNVIYLLYVAT